MATVVQSAVGQASSATTDTITFSSAVTSGNDVLVCAYALGAQVTSVTFDGNAMTEDHDTNFGFNSYWRYRATGGTDVVVNTGGSTTFFTAAIEVSGLVDNSLDGTVAAGSDGDGTTTSHSLEITNSGANRFVFGFIRCPGTVTFTGTGGATCGQVTATPDNNGFIYQDGVGSGAQALTFTTSSSITATVSAVSYEESSGGGVIIPRQDLDGMARPPGGGLSGGLVR